MLCSRVSFRLSVRQAVSRVILRDSALRYFTQCPIWAHSVYWGFTHNFFPLTESQVNHIGAYCKVCDGIFAFICGYGITKKYCNSRKNISQQAISQYISSMKTFWPVFIICVFGTAIIDGRPFTVYAGQSFLHSFVNFLLDGLGLAKLMETPSLNDGWWCLSAVAVFAFAAPLFQKAVKYTGWLVPAFFLLAFPRIIGMCYLPSADIRPFYFLMPVLLGVIFAEYDLFEHLDSIQLKPGNGCLNCLLRLAVASAMLLASYKAFHFLPVVSFWEYHYALAPLVFILFFHEWMQAFPLLIRPLARLGKHSGNIYFIHGLLLGYYFRTFLFSMPLIWLTPLATYTVCLVFSVVLERGKTYFNKKVIQKIKSDLFPAYLHDYWHNETLWQLVSSFLFAMVLFLLDIGLRSLHPEAGSTLVYDVIPQQFTLSWVIIFTAAALLLPKLIRKFFVVVVGGVFLLLFLLHSIMIQAKGNFFSFNSLLYAEDGLRFLDVSYINVSPCVWFIFFLGLVMLILSILLVPPKGPCIQKVIICLMFIILGIWAICNQSSTRLSDQFENHEMAYTNYNSILYNNFSDANRCVMLCGLYQYTFRDFCTTYGVYDWWGRVNYADQIAMLDAWYESKIPDADNEWTGRFAGKNLILIQLEAIDSWMIDEQFMPNLYGIQKDSINFINHYSPMYSDAGTFNTEMLVNTGCIIPFAGARSSMYSQNYYPYSLATLMRVHGYQANSFHRSSPSIYDRGDSHTNWGYEKYYSGEDMGIPIERLDFDTELMRAYDLIAPVDKQFFSFIITYSAHGPYEHSAVSDCYFDVAKASLPPDTNEMIVHAVARARVTDDFIGQLYDRLEQDGQLENTVLAFYSDHFDYYVGWDLALEIKDAENFDMASHTPFFIYEKGTPPQEIKKATSSIDILPSLVNLFDLDTDGRYYVGNDAFSSNGGYIIFKDFSWYDGETYWNAATSGELTHETQARNEELMRRLEMSWVAMQVNYFHSLDHTVERQDLQ